MRILAIRGQNLASLAERFAVDFEAEPIRTAGIFAISGPTGAGKSTLLDAMCLALFDKLPRFDHADGKARIGRPGEDEAALQPYDDVRNVLRHGAAEAFAEVDFTGQDGRSYRARWQVRRARGRSDGKIQDQSVTLADIETGQRIGDKKTETLGEIARRVGLNFGQFRRAVLLAQGDFDTFIKADAKTRAELLERITGTGIYAELSKAAFQRRRAEEQAVKALEDRLAGSRPLDPEARAAAVAAEAQARRALEEIDREKALLAQAAAWHDGCIRLLSRLKEAQAAADAAQEADAAQAAARAELAVCERAFAVRAELDDARRAAADVESKRQALAVATADAEQARTAVDQATTARVAAERCLAEARQEAERAEPGIRRARELDTVLGHLRSEAAGRMAERARRQVARDDAHGALEQALLVHAALAATRAANEAWLKEHQPLAALAQRLDDVLHDLTASASLGSRIASAGNGIREIEAERAALAVSRTGRAGVLAELTANLLELEQRVEEGRKAVDAIDRTTTQQRLDQARTALVALDSLADRARAAQRARSDVVAGTQNSERNAHMRKAAADEVALAEKEVIGAAAALKEARRNLELSAAAAGEHAQHLRLLLVEGEPCPVCGAIEHAHAAVDEILSERAGADRGRVAALEAVLEQWNAKLAGGRTRIETLDQAQQDLAARLAAAADDVRQATQQYEESAVRATALAGALVGGWPTWPEDPASFDMAGLSGPIEQLTSLGAQAEAELVALAHREAGLRADQKSCDEVRRAREAEERAAVADAERDHKAEADLRLAVGLLAHDRAALERNMADLDVALSPALPDWRARLAADHEALAGCCRRLAAQWSDRAVQAEELAQKLASADAGVREGQAVLAAQEAALADAGRALADLEAKVAQVEGERATVLDGMPADQVADGLREKLRQAGLAMEGAASLLGSTERMLATAEEAAAAAARAASLAQVEQAASEAKLVAVLAARQLARDQAELALARGDGWLSAERERLAAVRRLLDESQATLAERRKALREHEEAGRPTESVDEVQARAAELDLARPAAEAAHREHWAVLAEDDRTGREQAALRAQIEARRGQADVWLRLSDLIGSHDGAKFRRFAQNLTLTQLIALANRHLADLHPRYELQRAPGGDLVLQVVDRYMADEVRGVHSLSGGERFLISLALALGLASLSSSHGIRVESLFIDEGFGALDAQSLSMAVSVLERLQATGRRIGVISHVEELKERIAVKVEVTPRGSGRSTVAVTVS